MKHSKACRHYVEPAKTPTRKKKTKDAEEAPEPKDEE